MPDLFCNCGRKFRYDIRQRRAVCDFCADERAAGREPGKARRPTPTARLSSTRQLLPPPSPLAELILPAPRSASDGAQPLLKLPGLQRGKQTKRPRILEVNVQQPTIKKLREFGYGVLQTTVRFKRVHCLCARCGHSWFTAPKFETGQDKGISDLLVYSPKWRHPFLPSTLYLPLEEKGSHTQFSSDEQEKLAEEGHIAVARSVEQGLTYVGEVDQFWTRVGELEELLAAVQASDALPKELESMARAISPIGSGLLTEADEGKPKEEAKREAKPAEKKKRLKKTAAGT